MAGFLFAIVASVVFAIREGTNKKLTERMDVSVLVWASTLLSLVFFAIALAVEGMPEIEPSYWIIFPIAVASATTTSVLLIRAIQCSPLSLTLPFLSFSPAFMIFTSYIMLHELPNTWGIIGIGCIVVGSYLINLEKTRQGFLAPLKAIWHERGSFYALIVALIWSVASNIDKMALERSSAFFYLLTVNIGVLIPLTAYVLYTRKRFVQQTKAHIGLLATVAALSSIGSTFQMLAIARILVPYVIAIKRGGTILGSIVLGKIFFHEKNIAYRLVGATAMIIGIIFILAFH
ncbi:MAG: DMT family transporter [Patescibacteria group bacterium]